jgi:hypothetical protein
MDETIASASALTASGFNPQGAQCDEYDTDDYPGVALDWKFTHMAVQQWVGILPIGRVGAGSARDANPGAF